jgi:hypothetical protein
MKSATDVIEAPALNHLNPGDFSGLVRAPEKGGPVVTLFLPMERRGAETRKNRTHFKNALAEATELLARADSETDGLKRRFRKLGELAAPRAKFWQHQSNGLAIAIDEESIRCWRIPLRPSPAVHLGSRPALGFLLRLTDPSRLRFLTLDLTHTRLFEAGPQSMDELGLGVEELGLGDAPAGLDRLDDSEIHFNPSAPDDRELHRELHRKLCREVADRSDAAVRRAIDAYRQADAADRASSDLGALLGATVQGRLSSVLLAPAKPIYGVFDRESGEVDIHSERQPGDENLLEALAIDAALQGAEVRFVDSAIDGLPDGAVAAGIFRF